LPVLVVDLYVLDHGELLEIKADEISNVEIFAFRCACPGQIDVCHTVGDFQFTVAGESVIDGDPAIRITFRGAGTFEIFIERCLRQHARARPAVTGHFDGRQVVVVAELVRKVDIDQLV